MKERRKLSWAQGNIGPWGSWNHGLRPSCVDRALHLAWFLLYCLEFEQVGWTFITKLVIDTGCPWGWGVNLGEKRPKMQGQILEMVSDRMQAVSQQCWQHLGDYELQLCKFWMAQPRIHYLMLSTSQFNKHVPGQLSSICPSRSTHSAFLHPAVCPGRLTCMDYISRLPCPLTPIWVQPIEPWQKIRSREKNEVRVLVSLAA